MFEDEIKSSRNIKNIVFQYGTVKTGSLNFKLRVPGGPEGARGDDQEDAAEPG